MNAIRHPVWVLLLLAIFACTARGDDEDTAERPEPQALDAFLLDWVHGTARYEYFAVFHEIGHSSPHRQDTEEFEVSAKAYFFRRDNAPNTVEAFARKLLALHAEEETKADVRLRILHLLGRLAVPSALDLLCRAVKAGVEPAFTTAIESLACFGDAPREELFGCYGGTLRSVVLPAIPSKRARQLLLELIRQDPPKRAEDEPGKAFRERLHQWLVRRYAVAEALEAQRGRDVVETLLDELARKRYPWSGFPCVQEDLVEVLAANRVHVLPADLKRLQTMRQDAKAESFVRELAAKALEELGKSALHEPRKPGVYRFGG